MSSWLGINVFTLPTLYSWTMQRLQLIGWTAYKEPVQIQPIHGYGHSLTKCLVKPQLKHPLVLVLGFPAFLFWPSDNWFFTWCTFYSPNFLWLLLLGVTMANSLHLTSSNLLFIISCSILPSLLTTLYLSSGLSPTTNLFAKTDCIMFLATCPPLAS